MNVGRPPTQMFGCYIFMRRTQDGVANNNAGHCGTCILPGECQAGRDARAFGDVVNTFPETLCAAFRRARRPTHEKRDHSAPRMKKRKWSGAEAGCCRSVKSEMDCPGGDSDQFAARYRLLSFDFSL